MLFVTVTMQLVVGLSLVLVFDLHMAAVWFCGWLWVQICSVSYKIMLCPSFPHFALPGAQLCPYAFTHLFFMSNRRDLVKALKEKYFDEAESDAEVFQDWKPDEVNAVKANTWEWVFVNSLPPILVIGIH